jgi:hypothetical protein
MRRTFLIAAAAVLAAAPLVAQRTRAVSRLEPPVRILFVGNSLTAQNDLPALVCRLAGVSGRAATCESVVGGGLAIEDHLARGIVQQRLAEQTWSFVVLQQGPSALESSRINLREHAMKIAPAIRSAGATPVLYAVWPSKARSRDFPRVSESYRLAANDINGLFAPAGDAWLEAWRLDPSIRLYDSDDFHPSLAGSYLAALVIHRAIFGDVPDDDPESGLSLGDLQTVVAAARK